MSDKSKPAFPRSATGSAETGQIDQGAPGMTLREYYAGLAMQGIMTDTLDAHADVAKEAVKMADALIAELQREADDE